MNLNFQSRITSIDVFQKRYQNIIKNFEYDNNQDHAFNGILAYLSDKCNGNILEKNVIKFTYSSICGGHSKKEHIFNLNDKKTYFQFDGAIDGELKKSWFIIDFGLEMKIRPNKYSIRSRESKKEDNHMMNWNIEGSNSGEENDWKILDFKNDEKSLDYAFAQNTFDISSNLMPNEFFRYIRFQQTGPDSEKIYYGCISAIEFFGSLMIKQ